MKTALVVSGGGAKGAFGGGVINYLYDRQHRWDMLFGTSTGSLLMTLASLGNMELMKEAYTSVNQKSIFSVNPFNSDGSINIPNAIWRLLRGKTSLGENANLEKLIRKYFTEENYNETFEAKIPLFACVTNYTTGDFQFGISFKNVGGGFYDFMDYDKFIKYIIASTSVPLITDLVTINDCQYLDGGVMQHIPLQKAIDEGATHIDCIILRKEVPVREYWMAKNMFKVLMRTTDLMQTEISQSNVIVGKLEAQEHDVTISFYYTPRVLTDNSMMFDKQQMLDWWFEGYTYAKNLYELVPAKLQGGGIIAKQVITIKANNKEV